jgi:hypothetical protein
LLVALPRLTALNQYVIVDEADRWRWAKDFVNALSQGDLAGTRVGDGYPGIVPIWAESSWILLEAARRSLVEGGWIGQPGLYLLLHEWDRPAYLYQQRLPIVLLNTALVLAIVWAVWRLFGARVALVSGVLIALDPFYLSDSRVNRAEAVITGLMTLSILSLIFYHRQRHWRYVFISGILGGLSFLTKIQALVMLPAVALISIFIFYSNRHSGVSSSVDKPAPRFASLLPASRSYSLIKFGLAWVAAAALTWFLLWPSMWVTPVETLNLVYDYATRKVGAEGVNLFFMGQTYADADPGPIFYPFVFLMRVTPLVLLGLVGYVLHLMFTHHALSHQKHASRNVQANITQHATERSLPLGRNTLGWKQNDVSNDASFTTSDSFILLIFVFVYTLAMTLGSHKQDRYLMPIFPSLNILAAMGLLWLWERLKIWIREYGVGTRSGNERRKVEGQGKTPSSYSLFPTAYFDIMMLIALILIQLATALPHHPYYYSYFNPLLGGGQMAVRTMRIGWGEGMDQVGAYLAAKPDSRNLVVTSRFTHNMVGFRGELISLLPDGRWTQADYIVLYIQQVQRRQEPSPGFIDYFQARTPEKVITISGIDYAWIYPTPFTTPANPTVSFIPTQAALLGYSWETSQQVSGSENSASSASPRPLRVASSPLRLLWENLGLAADRQLAARLVGPTAQTEWATCSPDPAFVTQTRTPGAYVESLCPPAIANLPPDTYTVEIGLIPSSKEGINEDVETFIFPQGWHAATITTSGMVTETPELERLEAIANQAVPAKAPRLDRIYEGRLRLVAYQLDPSTPRPGETVNLTLYWQVVKEVSEPIHLTVQLADSRSLSLGRTDAALPADKWFLGEVQPTQHSFKLVSDLELPLAVQVEVELRNQAEVVLRPTTLTGEALGANLARFTIAPERWPTLARTRPVEATWQNGLALKGYTLSPQPPQPGQTLSVSLLWEASQPVAENYIVFVHLLDEMGQIVTQNDDLPRAGAYPIPWWQPGVVVEDVHPLALPPDLPEGVYQLVVGLYRPEDGVRLMLSEGGDSFKVGTIETH